MSLVVTHNLSAMQTQRNMTINNRGLSKSLEKLSSGFRINVGADDPSGLVISEQLRSQISGVQRAIRNTSEACNLIGLTEGALIEMNEILKKMRQLAIHSANSGVTSPEQVKANQAEVDSGISTIDRIANTTAYSDQFILNGSKQLVYDRLTEVKSTMDHPLINMQSSRVDQIFKRAGVSMTFSHAGLNANGFVNDSTQAKKAYLEADRLQPDPHNPGSFINSPSQYDNNGRITATQEFILTGTKGTKLFKFAEGEHLGTIASSINNVRDSLGIGATLIFGSDARIDMTTNSAPARGTLYDLNRGNVSGLAAGGINFVPALGAGSGLNVAGFSINTAGIVDNGNWLADIFQLTGDGTGTPGGAISFSLNQPAKASDSWSISFTANGEDLGTFYIGNPAAGAVDYTLESGPLAGTVVEIPLLTSGNVAALAPLTTGNFATTFTANDKQSPLYDYRAPGDIQIYGANINGGPTQAKVTGVSLTNAEDFRAGMNCDGDARVYAKVTKFISVNDYEVEWYKDKACTMLIGSSSTPTSFSATNNSGITNNGLTIGLTNAAAVGDVYTVGLVGQEFALARDSDGKNGIDQPADFNVNGLGGWGGMTAASLEQSVMSGIQLGYNTSTKGSLFFKATGPVNDRIIEVFKDESMSPSSRVAIGRANLSGDPDATPPGNSVIRLEEVMMDSGEMSGLNLTLNFSGAASSGLETGSIDFTNLALRLHSTDYGSDQYIRIQNNQGQLFHQFRYGDSLERQMVPEQAVVQVDGQDALLSMNGFPVVTRGLIANITTPDFQAAMAMNAGMLGLTTIAQAGYDVGSLFSRAQALQAIPEDETVIRQVEMGKGSKIFPAVTTHKGQIAGISTGVAPEVADNGILTFDLTGIDVETHLTSAARATFISAFQNGLTITVKEPGTPGTNLVNIEIDYVEPNGSPGKKTLADVPFSALNSTDGYTVNTTNPAATDFDKIFDGLTIKGNQLSSNAGMAIAGATTFTLDTTLRQPAYTPLTQVFTYATNARHTTSERLDNFIGGMQFQLGGNESDQDRTVYSVPSMVMANIGRMEWNGRVYTLQDVLDGGEASLSRDPILAMRVISQAVDDVSTLRGRLGAFQANMLQTNQNSLEVAVEMLTKTESAIRDTNMAEASTEFTKNQILMQAGTAMLAQANQINQNVLQLLG